MRVLPLLLMAFLPGAAAAQMAATLVADDVVIEDRNTLIATGNIEVLYEGNRLTASQITYLQDDDRLIITGPILITGPNGEIITASQATLDPQLENGMLLGARLVLDQQVQLAASQIDRADGRLSQLYKAAVTSCQVCSGKSPLWEIRAEQVVYDEEAQQLYFNNATFRVKGLPILYLPRFHLPGPENTRATGLLIPNIRSSDQLGFGLQVPYFITLGDSRDLLLTPWLSSETTTLGLRYRQAFASGMIEISASGSADTLTNDERGYVFASGAFNLDSETVFSFDIKTVSDDAYLLHYGISDLDRLPSTIGLTRIQDDFAANATLSYYQTLRADERNATLPPVVADATAIKRIFPNLGGTLTITGSTDAIVRYGDATGDEGRDVTRIGGAARWDRRWIADMGLVTGATGDLRADVYQIDDATAFDDQIGRVVPTAALTLRYPLIAQSGGTRHLLEPVAMIAYSGAFGGTPPNEDSNRQELDQGNLLALSHFPGDDAVETGWRGAVALTWTRKGAEGIESTLVFGRVLRDAPDDDFTVVSGLSATGSDWLVAGRIGLPRGLTFEGRAMIDTAYDPTLATGRVYWQNSDVALAASYIWQKADPAIDRPDVVSEWSVDGKVQVTPQWDVIFDSRYDVANDEPASAGLGIGWRNECVRVSLSVSRRYTSSSNVSASTDYGLSVSLGGFSANGAQQIPTKSCES